MKSTNANILYDIISKRQTFRIHFLLDHRRSTDVYVTKQNCAKINTTLLINYVFLFLGNLGNIHYQNATVQIEHNVHLFKGFSLQLTGRGGLLENKLHPERPIPLNNLFLVGGPLTLRGFECLGPFDDNFPLGSNMYWSTGIHLWAPLPFNSYFHNYGKYFRTHVFYNLGNNNRDPSETLTDLNSSSFLLIFLPFPDKIRSSCGLGIAVSILQLARIEINYHIPVRYQPGDRLKDGFDFNIGVDFV